MMLSSIPYAFLIFFAPQIIETWVGRGYPQSVYVMQILGVGTFINLFTGIGTACVRGMGKPRYEIQYMMVSAILILVLAVPLIRQLGIAGAAWAYCIGQTVGSLYFLWLANRLFDVSWPRFVKKVLPSVFMMFAMGLPSTILCNFLWPLAEHSRWLKLGILAVVGIFYVMISLVVLNLFQQLLLSNEERKKILSLPIPGTANGIWKRLWRSA
jgi:O-antigen/teichoic acid export membrane protein